MLPRSPYMKAAEEVVAMGSPVPFLSNMIQISPWEPAGQPVNVPCLSLRTGSSRCSELEPQIPH